MDRTYCISCLMPFFTFGWYLCWKKCSRGRPLKRPKISRSKISPSTIWMLRRKNKGQFWVLPKTFQYSPRNWAKCTVMAN
jgi:hypothetical protein